MLLPSVLAFRVEAGPHEYNPPERIQLQQGVLFLEGTYSVYFGKQISGQVHVTKCGLYYHFRCRCQLSGDVVCRLMVTNGKIQEKLGILVPMEDGFGLDTKLPCKRLKNDSLFFSLIPKTEKSEAQFAPIYPDEPFSYIEQLKDSFLVRKYGQPGILLK